MLSLFVFCVDDNKLCSSLSFSYYLLEAYIPITVQLNTAGYFDDCPFTYPRAQIRINLVHFRFPIIY